MVTNVIHNLAVAAQSAPAGEFLARASHPITLSQVGFMLFVAATARIAWLGSVRSGFGGQTPGCECQLWVEIGHSVRRFSRPQRRPLPPFNVAARARKSIGRRWQIEKASNADGVLLVNLNA
jgi:hypothetical protein